MSDLILTPSETPTDSPGTDTGYGKAPVGQSQGDCKAKAASEGGVAWDEHAQACWMIFGKAVEINEVIHSLEEFAKIVNFNFRTQGSAAAVPTNQDLPGPSMGLGGDSPGGVNV